MNPHRLLGKYSQQATAKMTHIKESFAFVSAFFPRCERVFSYGSPFNKVDRRVVAVELAKERRTSATLLSFEKYSFYWHDMFDFFSYYDGFSCKLCGRTELHQRFPEIDSSSRDIPRNAVKIYLNNNNISYIESGTFAKNFQCTKLRLDWNRLTEARKGMWKGLLALEWLSLEHNDIKSVQSSAFANLPNLKGLYLHNTGRERLIRTRLIRSST